MIKFTPTDEQKEYAKNLVENTNFGIRGDFDGNKYQQYVGILGQTVVADWLGMERPKDNGGFDGGIDFIINNITIDLKTMTRNVDMRPEYVHNLYGGQIHYETDIFMFANYNKYTEDITLCGWIPKELFLDYAKFYPEGTKRKRDNGTWLVVRGKKGMYEIKQRDLFHIPNNAKDFIKLIKIQFRKE